MKQLARTAVCWPNIDDDIVDLCRSCIPCSEHQNRPSKPPIHLWMVPEKLWSGLYLDHAVNFMGSNWLVQVDAHSKYSSIRPTQSISSKSTIDLLEQNFSQFGFPHTIVTENAPCFTFEKFKQFCKERGIIHLTGAPYHPSTNGAAEQLLQTFKLYGNLCNFQRKPCWTFCVNTGAHRQRVDSPLASYLMVDNYAQN